MNIRPFHVAALAASIFLLAACGDGHDAEPQPAYYTTKTPYKAQQDPATYEPPPLGFTPVYTELVARHGSRGLQAMGVDLALYNMWLRAAADGALTDLGAKLGPDVLKIMKANFLLGYGVSGISEPGYGNETLVGIAEHTGLAVRLLGRLPDYFKTVGDDAGIHRREVVVVTSGVDRAVDSAGFFIASLKATQPKLAPLLVYPPAPSGYPQGDPIQQAAGTNRFLLYFHKLVAATDLVTNPADPMYSTYQDSQAYQRYGSDPDQADKQAAIKADPAGGSAGRAVLDRLFTKAFVDKIEAGVLTFADSGTMSFTSDDGKFTNTLHGNGKTMIANLTDAGSVIYGIYSVAPALTHEASVDFMPYLPPEQAKVFAYIDDAADFYSKGPGMTEHGGVTYRMAQILLDDFFNEVDAVARGDMSHAAKLRFTHAEIMIPFASIMELKAVFQQIPEATLYSYENNSWRGEYVSPMATNMQWDVFSDSRGTLLIRMLFNEKETDFKTGCDSARYASTAHYYDYAKLKLCYSHRATTQ